MSESEGQVDEQTNVQEQEEEDIDIDADVNVTNDDNLFGSDDDEVQDENIGMKDLFGSDSDNDNENDDGNHNDTKNDDEENEENKVLSRKYIRSVPEGKRITIQSTVALSELPNNDKFEFCILRLPNVIDCDIDPFDDKQYIPSSTSSSIDNYIRWRAHYESATDETFKESNTKLIFWNDGTKSLMIGNDCYDIDQQILNGNRDYIYYNVNENTTNYKLSHSQINKRLNVRTTTTNSYKTLQKNLAKKHQRTKGSKQLTALQRRHNRDKYKSNTTSITTNNISTRKRNNNNKKKRTLKESFLEQGGHGNDTSDDEDYNYNYNNNNNKRHKQSSESSSSSNESDDDESDSEDDDEPIGQRL